MRRGESVGLAAAARRVQAETVAEPRDHPGLVLGDPGSNPVAEASGDDLHVLGEGADRVTGRPPTSILEGLRQVPVVQGHVRLDSVREQLVDEAVVEVEPRRVRPAASLREDSRPGDREPEGVETELAHQADVLRVAVIRVAGHGAVVAVADVPRLGAEAIPDALAAPVLVHRALCLVCRRGRAPDEGGGNVIH